MLAFYLKIAFRSIGRNKASLSLNVFGLAVGMICCLAIFISIINQMSFDSFHSNKEELFYLTYSIDTPAYGTIRSGAAFAAGPVLNDELPEVGEIARIVQCRSSIISDQAPIYEFLTFADASLFTLFSFPLVRGNSSEALSGINSVVITERKAGTLFGDDDPMGKTISIKMKDGYRPFIVSGVARDVPSNSSIFFDIVLPIECVEYMQGKENALDSWGYSGATTFITLNGNCDRSDIENKINTVLSKHVDTKIFPHRIDPLRSLHFDHEIYTVRTFNARNLYILMSLAGLVLIIASFNFMNMTTTRFASRAMEMSIHRTIGSSRMQLMARYLTETMAISSIAIVSAYLFLCVSLPSISKILGQNIPSGLLLHPYAIIFVVLLGAVTGLLPGLYPAVILSFSPTINTLQKKIHVGGRNIVTYSLIVLQHVISIALIISAITMAQQNRYLRDKEMGYDDSNLLIINVDPQQSSRIYSEFRQKLMNHPDILGISATSSTFMGSYSMSINIEGKEFLIDQVNIDYDYPRVAGITLVAGREFSPSISSDVYQSIIVNESLADAFEWVDPIGQTVEMPDGSGSSKTKTVIGVIKDFHVLPTNYEITPTILTMDPQIQFRYICLRLREGYDRATMDQLTDVWTGIEQDMPFDYYFVSDRLEGSLTVEKRWAEIISYSSVIAIIITIVGLIAQNAVVIRQRMRELCIRQILGASLKEITMLLYDKYFKIVLLSCAISWPIGYIVMNKWLDKFPYKIEIGLSPFVTAAALAILISFVSILIQINRSTSRRPADVLRVE